MKVKFFFEILNQCEPIQMIFQISCFPQKNFHELVRLLSAQACTLKKHESVDETDENVISQVNSILFTFKAQNSCLLAVTRTRDTLSISRQNGLKKVIHVCQQPFQPLRQLKMLCSILSYNITFYHPNVSSVLTCLLKTSKI